MAATTLSIAIGLTVNAIVDRRRFGGRGGVSTARGWGRLFGLRLLFQVSIRGGNMLGEVNEVPTARRFRLMIGMVSYLNLNCVT